MSDLSELLRRRRPDLPRLTLKVDCPEITKRREWDRRAYAHVGHHANKICVLSMLAAKGPEHTYGVLLHEVGHIGADLDRCPKTEKAANDWVKVHLGFTIVYRGDPPIQWVAL